MLPAVIRFNGAEHAPWYAELLREVEPDVKVEEAPSRLAALVESWMREAGLATTLTELSIPPSGIDSFVKDAMKQWTGTFNPVPLDEACVENLYRDVA
jgi:alcohol dehydrogenase